MKIYGDNYSPYIFYVSNQFAINRLTSKKRRGTIIADKDKHAIFMEIPTTDYIKGGRFYGYKNQKIIPFILCLILFMPGITAEAKSKLAAKEKTMTTGQTYQLKLKGVSGKAKVKWKSNKKSIVSISKKKENTVTLKAKKKGTATITATCKNRKYKCKVTVKKLNGQTSDDSVLNSTDVTLYGLDDSYRDYIKYDSSHIREYRFRVSGTKKEVRTWDIIGENADYFKITGYGLLQLRWESNYIEPCVTAMVLATLEDGRKLTATVRAYSELNIYIDSVFTEFEKQYITSSMTEKEKAEKAAWYIGATSDYELYNPNWTDIFLTGKGDCSASRYALQYMCNHMGLKAIACSNLDAHGETLVYADGRFYVAVTGYNEPKPRRYAIYETGGEALEKLVEENNIDLDCFRN